MIYTKKYLFEKLKFNISKYCAKVQKNKVLANKYRYYAIFSNFL
jgi:hypothetical protein